ncbi:MAG TPA: tetratricopeptide repeat protein, partial [Burkholderiaceae bacterium]
MGNWIKTLFSKRSDALAASDAVPGYVRGHQEQGDAWFQDGDFAAAAASYRQALKFDPDIEAVYGQLCFALCQQGKWDEARDVILAGIARFPQSVEFHFLL